MSQGTGKMGAARNSSDGIGKVASLCFGCTETACNHSLKLQECIPLVDTV